jgi:O-antigen/teichoic acid export membrane protein
MGEEIGENIKNFAENLLEIGISSFISTGLVVIFNILSGRILGPNEYGKFTVVQSVAMFLYIPMILGFNTAMVKYSSEKDYFDRQKEIISTSYFIVTILTFISILLYFIFNSQLINLFSVSTEMFYLSILFAVLFALYNFTTDTLRGLFKMKLFANSQIIYAIVLLLTFLFFIFVKNSLSFHSMLYSTFLSYALTGVFLLFFPIRKYICFTYNKFWGSQLTKYSILAAIGGFSTSIYTNIDKVLINKYMTPTDVGIYKAYYLASINVAGLFWRIFNVVYFPTVSKYQNKLAVFKKINKMVPYLIVLGTPFILFLEIIIIKLYGKKYPFDLLLIFLFGIVSISVVIDSFYAWFLNSIGTIGVKITVFAAAILAIVNIGINILLIPSIGLIGAIISALISLVVCISIEVYWGKKYLNREIGSCR